MTGLPSHEFGCTCGGHVDRPWNRPEHWTVKEIDYLESRFGRWPDAAIARHLGRTVVGIRLKAKRLGIRKRDAGLTAIEVGRLLSVDNTIVSKIWMRRGLLKHRRAYPIGLNRALLTTYAHVEAFIRDHGQWLNAERVPVDSPFKALAMANRWVSLSDLVTITGHGKKWLLWYFRSGLFPVRRKGPQWFMPAQDVWKLPTRPGEALEYSRFVNRERLQRRRDRRKGVAA